MFGGAATLEEIQGYQGGLRGTGRPACPDDVLPF